jgi:alanine dehydrogenase
MKTIKLKKGLNIANGKILYKGVAEAWNLPFDEEIVLANA